MDGKADMMERFMKLEKISGLTLDQVKGTEEKLSISVEQAKFYDLYDLFQEHCEDFKICNSKDGTHWIVYDVERKGEKHD